MNPYADDLAPLPPGAYVAARFRLERLLGRGGMATVYAALDLRAQPAVPVALKLYHLPHGENQDARWRRARREASELARLHHPGVVRLVAAGPWLDFFFVAMELVAGRTLLQELAAGGPLPEPRLRALGHQVALTLTQLWRHRLVHRDVTPGNLMLLPDGTVKLLDFGIAKQPGVGTLTAQSRFIGSPHHSAPEAILAETTLDGRADVYSLGATLYHAASGQPPFDGQDQVAVLEAHFRWHPRPLAELCPDLSPALGTLVMRMLARDRAERPWPEAVAAALADA